MVCLCAQAVTSVSFSPKPAAAAVPTTGTPGKGLGASLFSAVGSLAAGIKDFATAAMVPKNANFVQLRKEALRQRRAQDVQLATGGPVDPHTADPEDVARFIQVLHRENTMLKLNDSVKLVELQTKLTAASAELSDVKYQLKQSNEYTIRLETETEDLRTELLSTQERLEESVASLTEQIRVLEAASAEKEAEFHRSISHFQERLATADATVKAASAQATAAEAEKTWALSKVR